MVLLLEEELQRGPPSPGHRPWGWGGGLEFTNRMPPLLVALVPGAACTTVRHSSASSRIAPLIFR